MTNLGCDPEQATAFLQEFSPDAPWALTAIWPQGIPGIPEGKKNIYTETFNPDEVERCKAWIKEINDRGWNIYFMINPPKRYLNKKGSKDDVAEVRWLYVDLDPRAGEPLEQERERIEKLLTTNLPKQIPKPTVIVNSGGGMWGFWKLKIPLSMSVDRDGK